MAASKGARGYSRAMRRSWRKASVVWSLPLMEEVGAGEPAGQGAQGRGLGSEELPGRGLGLAVGAVVDAVTPGARLAVGVGPVGEAPARQKAALDEAEHPLDAAGAIGI